FVLPCLGLPPTGGPYGGVTDGFQVVHQTPADDTHTWRVDIQTRRSGPIRGRTPGAGVGPAFQWPGLEGMSAVGPDWRKRSNKENDYLIDRNIQKTTVYAGVPFGAHTQDACVTETMGAVSDRHNA